MVLQNHLSSMAKPSEIVAMEDIEANLDVTVNTANGNSRDLPTATTLPSEAAAERAEAVNSKGRVPLVTHEPQFVLCSDRGLWPALLSLAVALVVLLAFWKTPGLCIPLVFLLGSYHNECSKCRTLSYLANETGVGELANAVFDTCAFRCQHELTLTMRCYHEERVSDSTAHGSHKAAVVTHHEIYPVMWGQLIDASHFTGMSLPEVTAAIAHWKSGSRALIQIDSEWILSDADGSLARLTAAMHGNKKHLDTQCKVTLSSSAPASFKANQTIQIGDLPTYIGVRGFWLTSCLMLTVSYRMLFETYTANVKITYKKNVTGFRVGQAVAGFAEFHPDLL